MSDFLLDNDGDIKLTDFDFSLVVDTDELAQRLLIKLRAYKGELFYNTLFGIPYYQNILGKNREISIVESIFKQAITEEDFVKKLLEFSMDFVPTTRTLTISFLAELFTGEELAVNEVVL